MKKRVKLDEEFTPIKIAQALSDRRILYTEDGRKLFYDEVEIVPFRANTSPLRMLWKCETFYEDIEIEWPNQDLCPCLCWLNGKHVVIVDKILDAYNAVTISGATCYLDKLRPFTKEESDKLTLKVE